MKTKKLILGTVAAAVLASSSLSNAGEIEANVALSTDYVFRGFSQTYPGDTDDFNYSEFVASVSFSDISLGVVYSPDYFGSDDSAIVLNADYSVGLAENLGLDLHVGYSDVDADDFFAAGEDSYIDYSASLTTSGAGVDFALTYYGTDIDDIDAADDRVVFSISKAF